MSTWGKPCATKLGKGKHSAAGCYDSSRLSHPAGGHHVPPRCMSCTGNWSQRGTLLRECRSASPWEGSEHLSALPSHSTRLVWSLDCCRGQQQPAHQRSRGAWSHGEEAESDGA